MDVNIQCTIQCPVAKKLAEVQEQNTLMLAAIRRINFGIPWHESKQLAADTLQAVSE